MQKYTEISQDEGLLDSLAMILNNDKTALSCSSGTAFPTVNVQIGQLCFRTDENRLYQTKDGTNWIEIADLSSSLTQQKSDILSATVAKKEVNKFIILREGFNRFENHAATVTGTIAIRLPVRRNTTMLTMKIRGFNYTANKSTWDLDVGGYLYSSGWVNTSAFAKSALPWGTTVRFADDGTYTYVLLGTTTTVWAYPRIWLDEVMVSVNQSGDVADPSKYYITLLTDETGFSVESTVTVNAGTSAVAVNDGVYLSTAQTISGAKTFSAVTNVTNATDATSATTGGLVVSGGVGIGKQLRAGGAVTFGSTLAVSGGSTFTGQTIHNGGISATTGTFNTTTDSTSTVTGALQTKGGLGVAKSAYIGGNANIAGALDVTGKVTAAGGFAGSLVGNVTGDLTGNAATATKLVTARTINGVAFDGSADITIADSTKLPLAGGTVTGTIDMNVENASFRFGKNFDIGFVKQNGSSGKMIVGNVNNFEIVKSTDASIPSTISPIANQTFATLLSLTPTGVLTTPGGFNGNASTATKLQTARTIGGVSFDGSANINLPGVNATGNQATTGNAGTATKLATARTIALSGAVTGTATNFDGSENITIATTSIDGSKINTGTIPAARIPTLNQNTTGSAKMVLNQGNVAALTGTAIPERGLSMVQGYSNGYPHPYGNSLQLGGSGQGEIYVGWSGADGGLAPSYIRSKRDTTTATWSEWREILFKDQLSATNVGTATKLATARTINGVSFDGSANIDLPVFATDKTGLVPARTGATTTKFLREDGTWVVPTDTTYAAMTAVEAAAGVATTARLIAPSELRNAIQTHAPTPTSVAGNAGTATKLATARTINGTAFDGTASITTANWGTARTLTVGNTGKSVNGSANVSWTLAEIGAAAANHEHSYLPLSGGTVSGNVEITDYLTTSSIRCASDFGFYTPFSGAQRVLTGGLLVSNAYVDASKIPSDGIYSKGEIVTETGRISSPTSAYHYIDLGKDGADRQIFGSYGGVYYFRNTVGNVDVVTINNGSISANGAITGNQFRLTGIGDTNYITNGNGDAASYSSHNMIIRSWWGIGFRDNNDVCRTVLDTRTGNLSTLGTIAAASVVASGNVTAFSDKRIKENVTAIENALTKVEKLNGVTFKRKDTLDRQTGLLAQEVEAVLPEAVTRQKASEEIKAITGDEEVLAVNYGALTGLLVESIKELNGKLKAQLELIDKQAKLIENLINKVSHS